MTKIANWPKRSQWRHFFKVLNKKEKIILLFFIAAFLFSVFFLAIRFYNKNTEIMPKDGGTHIEGVIGQPRFINPIYANSDTDRDLTQLIFSGLMKYDENLNIVYDLAQNYEIEENGLIYKFHLKENLFWQNGSPLTADDIVFTIKTIQNPDYKSPLRANWIGVEVEKISDLAVRFKLKKPYNSFLENCAVKIISKEIWQNIPSENFALESYNLEPIGSGPYKIKKIDKDKNGTIKYLILDRNPLFSGKKPYISEIKFIFYNSDKELLSAAQQKKIKGFSLNSYKTPNNYWANYRLSLPRYFALFLNPQNSKVLEDKNIRTALNYATDKKEIVKSLFELEDDSIVIKEIIAQSPILSNIYGLKNPLETYGYNIETAQKILDESGFKDNDSDGIREKKVEKIPAFQFKKDLSLNSQGTDVKELQKCLMKFPDIFEEGEATGNFGEKTKEAVIKFQEKYAQEILVPSNLEKGNGVVKQGTREKLNEVCFESGDENILLKFSLATVDQENLVKVAKIIKEQWKKAGVKIEINKLPISQLEQDIIKTRNYDILLFGEALGAIPDLLPFWHSSQKIDPGLNLAVYENKDADALLEEIRKTSDINERAIKLETLQDIIINDSPAVFLYCPDYIYLASKEIKGIEAKKIVDPSKRFIGIENWYINTRRIWK